MRWVRDPTGRFPQRPYYDQAELDVICEQVVSDFLISRYGQVDFPISTNDLTILVERDAAELDLYADLTQVGPDVEGVTDFCPGAKPRVRITAALSLDPRREHRLRTTLTHEYGHVHLHNLLYGLEQTLPMFEGAQTRSPTCKRETMLQAPLADWMEWQAGYACGSLLMPITSLRQLMAQAITKLEVYGSVSTASPAAIALLDRVSDHFQVSRDAARVRLSRLGYLTDDSVGSPLRLR